MNTIEPFGYFRPTIDGWEDCAKDDVGARPLYERPAQTWQPIATAPKDAYVLVFSESDGINIAFFEQPHWVSDGFHIIWPTNWMPLPEPPK